jgi:nitroimidazol reductase NimA-like FMN-containing flavoprotein (pyridoxamine 5'-phosphate oxidase superfamily)
MTDGPARFHVRRKDREITSPDELAIILLKGQVCHLALVDDGEPYVVPVNYAYTGGRMYFHSATEGRKINVIKKNNHVCFNVTDGVKIVAEPKSCKVHYLSVTGTGVINDVTDTDEKLHGLKAIMRQNIGCEYDFQPKALDRTLVFRIDIRELAGKKAG